MNKKKFFYSIIILLLDQILKYIVDTFNTNVTIIKNILNIKYVENAGAAWGVLEGHSVLLILASILVLVLVYNLMFSIKEDKLSNLGFGLLFGGILGNLIDRVIYGYVRDFISIYIFGYSYPIFNIADMGIVIGVILVLISSIKGDVLDGNKGRGKRIKNR